MDTKKYGNNLNMDDYNDIETLGSGCYGIVIKAINNDDNVVAYKEISKNLKYGNPSSEVGFPNKAQSLNLADKE